jgi:hypothetical protein
MLHCLDTQNLISLFNLFFEKAEKTLTICAESVGIFFFILVEK